MSRLPSTPAFCLVLAGLVTPAFGLAQDAPVSGASSPSTPGSAPPSVAPPRPAVGPPPEVSLACAPEPVMVGEPLICTLTAVHPETVSIAVPLPAGAAEVLSIADAARSPADGESAAAAATTRRPDGRLETLRRFQVVPQEPKRTVKVPAVKVIYTEATGGVGEVEVPGRKVPLKRLLENVENPAFRTFQAPGQPPAQASSGAAPAAGAPASGDPEVRARFVAAHGPVPFVTTNWPALIAAIVLGGGLLGTLITVAVSRWLAARRRVVAPWVDPRPAHVIALAALDALQAESLPEQGRMKEFYFRLSEIVRAYLEKRYAFAALEMTSDEIRARYRALRRGVIEGELGARGLSAPELALLIPERLGQDAALIAVEDFLAETDWVKFADFAPSESAADTALRAARGIVALTREADDPATPTGGAASTAGGAAAAGGAA
ncbi:hypothetical protein L6V77_30940 [Myxococcota bacterium]|nr:hypothetical protein [Myxococcota bacterium]